MWILYILCFHCTGPIIVSIHLYEDPKRVMMALSSPGGHFVCKTFDLFTPFSVGLVYLLYLCFDRISLFKPVTSRPANSERWGCICVFVCVLMWLVHGHVMWNGGTFET